MTEDERAELISRIVAGLPVLDDRQRAVVTAQLRPEPEPVDARRAA